MAAQPQDSLPDGGTKEQASMHHQGSFRNYMQFKNIKLREQFDNQAFETSQISSIFEGVAIHVNGYTEPGHQDLKQLMALHGGQFENYFHRQNVTHIICSNLPDTKLKQMRNERKPIPIVKPGWVVASIKAGRLLPVDDFRLEVIRDAPHQRKIHTFQQEQPQHLPASHLYPILQQQSLASPPSSAMAAMARDVLSGVDHPDHAAALSLPEPLSVPLLGAAHESTWASSSPLAPPAVGSDMLHTALPAPQLHHPSPPTFLAPIPAPTTTPHSARKPCPPPSPPPPPASSSTATAAALPMALADAQATASGMRAACDVLRGAPRCSAEDPEGFVGSFFKSSRLHFIGTWKARVEDLFLSAPKGPHPTPHSAGSSKGRGPPAQRAIIHLDMDCFFASAAAVGRPELQGVPLAVSHSNSTQGSGEVSAASYEARAFGIRAGMFIAEAKRRCPQLVVVPYEFERYHAISDAVYRLMLAASACVQPLSCDEAFLDVTGLGEPQEIARQLRGSILEQTGCRASAGIGPNPLLARLATSRGKPNGQFAVSMGDVKEFLGELPVEELPGVGWSTKAKLQDLGLVKVCQVWGVSRELLQRHLGQKAGAALWDAAKGVDHRRVEPPGPRKSIGAEVNWGVRFGGEEEVRSFLERLAGEVADRMAAARVKGRTLTLKVKRRQAGAPEPIKFLGHGACDSLSRSETLPRFTDSAADVMRCCWGLLTHMAIPPADLRGLGITISRLDSDSTSVSAKASAAAPSKLAAPAQTTFDRSKPSFWAPAAPKAPPSPCPPQQHPLEECPPSPTFDALAPTQPPPASTGLQQQQQQQQHHHESGKASGAQCVASQQHPQQQPCEGDTVVPASVGTAAEGIIPESPGATAASTAAADDEQHQGEPRSPSPEDDDPECGLEVGGGGVWPGAWVQLPRPAPIMLPGATAAAPIAADAGDTAAAPRAPNPEPLSGGMEVAHSAAAQAGGGQVAGSSRTWVSGVSQEQQQQQQQAVAHPAGHAGSREPAGAAVGHAGGSKAGRASAAAALPPMSQVDREVLDALPLQLRRELELAYGVPHFPPCGHLQPAAASRPMAAAAKRGSSGTTGGPSKRQRNASSAPAAAALVPRPNWLPNPPSLDHDVLAELPLSLQQEVLAELQAAAAHGEWEAQHSCASAPGQHSSDGGEGGGPGTAGMHAGALGASGMQQHLRGKGGAVFADEDPAAVRRMLKVAVERVSSQGAGLPANGECGGAAPETGCGRGADTGRGECAGEAEARLLLVAEMAVQWMVGLEGNLEEVARGLSLVGRLGVRHKAFAAAAAEAVDAVQRHMHRRFGFKVVNLRPLTTAAGGR